MSSAAGRRAWLMAVALPLLMAGKCEEPLVQDSGFDLWCGDRLCDWSLTAGQIKPAPTWHDHDLGVELVGADVGLVQPLRVRDGDLDCLRFDLLADITSPVTVNLEVYFDDDLTPSRREALPTGSWIPFTYRLTAPTYFRSLRLVIHKTGVGRAVLARIQVLSSSDCTDPPPAEPVDRPAGATCEQPAQCGGGTTCRTRTGFEQATPGPPAEALGVCEACSVDQDCSAPGVCGVAFEPDLDEPFAACVAPGAASLGERCRGDAECESAVCCDGACSTCCPGSATAAPCAPGDACAVSARDGFGRPSRVAWQCAPRGGHGPSSARCLIDEDCASGHCPSPTPLAVCADDGRRCASAADCRPRPGNSCIALGVAGGRCQ